MNVSEIYTAVKDKSKQIGIDANFLYPAIICLGANITASEEDVFQAYFDSEIARLGTNPSEPITPARPEELRIIDVDKQLKRVSFFVKPEEAVTNLHVDIYKQMLWFKAFLMAKYFLQAESKYVNDIIRFLCNDIILKLRNPVSLN